MGIRIELTDDDLPEATQEIEISKEEVEQIMKNPPAECREIADKILLSISSREDGGIEIRPGDSGCIVLHSEKEAERFCESVIRSIRSAPAVREKKEPELLYEERLHEFVLDDSQDDELTDEMRYKWSFCPVVYKDDDGSVAMFAPGGNIIRFKEKEAAQETMDVVMRSFGETE